MQFSVIIATRNRRGLVGRAVTSVLAQGAEIIVVDDESSDGTPEYLEQAFPMIRVLRVPHGGPGPARNVGLEHARGRWAVVLDDDDELRPDALATIGRRLAQFTDRDHFPAFLFRYANGARTRAFELFDAHDFCNGAVAGDFLTVWNRDVARESGSRYPDVRIGAEGLMWLQIGDRFGVPAFGDVVGIVHHDAPGRLTAVDAQVRNAAEHAVVQDRYVSFLEARARTPETRHLIRRRLLAAGVYYLLAGERRAALARAGALIRYRGLAAPVLALACCLPRAVLVATLRTYRRAVT